MQFRLEPSSHTFEKQLWRTRAQNEARFIELEEAVENLHWSDERTRHRVDILWQVNEYVIEGSKSIEKLYKDYIVSSNVNAGGWKKIKEELQGAFTEELAIHIGLQYPLPAGNAGGGPDWDEQKLVNANALEQYQT